MTALEAATLGALALASGAALVRFLRVAQREHYLAGSATRFALRWWRLLWLNAGLTLLACAGAGASFATPPGAIATAVCIGVGPVGLGLRGRTSPLKWTRRMKSLAGLSASATGAVFMVGAFAGGLAGAVRAGALAAVGVPVIVDLSLACAAPIERRVASRFVATASRRLASVRPKVVAITGSYGKTSTKGYVAHLVARRFSVLASPRSFNNRAGLSRTVNELLVPGTEVFVAEMGAFGPGEIAALCDWIPPDVAVITAIGPVHLERFGTLDATLAAKAEITKTASIVVLNVDDERLARLADDLAAAGRHVVRASALEPGADVTVRRDGGRDAFELFVGGASIGASESGSADTAAAGNVACAAGVALALGLEPGEILAGLGGLPQPANRLSVERSAKGATVLDDTFNANPAGAAHALELLERLARQLDARRVVLVTPGMVELGPLQHEENTRFAASAARFVTDLVVVGRTNRAALVEGARVGKGRAGGACRLWWVANRERAVEWVRAELGAGDVVLYENDLPDHYP